MTTRRFLIALALSALTLASGARAEENLADLDLATLMSMDVTVTSASRRAQSIEDAAAAVFVITREDIRRSGATTLPEILELAPGMQVGRVNTRSWAVSTRGFSHRFSNKLLVMVDGRSIYTSAFSGVMWEEQPVFVDNIERIEVVRGPGGALWGVNAVNGVINIITRDAAQTHGPQASAGVGAIETESASLRFGDQASVGDYRVYADHARTEALSPLDGDWTRTLAGFRIDGGAAGGVLSLQGDVHESDFGAQDGAPEIGLSRAAQTGGALLNWRRDYSVGQLELRATAGWTERAPPLEWNESVLGVEGQFSARRLGRHTLTFGGALRRVRDEQSRATSQFLVVSSARDQWSAYGQDEIDFFAERLRITAGAKVEDTGFGGSELQPTLRALLKATPTHTVWAAASRAVRAPARFELHSYIALELSPLITGPSPLPVVLRVSGAEDLDGERLHAYEFGWRWRPGDRFSVDVAAYRNDYDELILTRSLTPRVELFPTPHILQSAEFGNVGAARTEGVEAVVEWAARDWLRLQAFGAWHELRDVALAPGAGTINGNDVGRTLSLHARFDLPRKTELDLSWRGVSPTDDGEIDGYDMVNMRLGWRPLASLELSLGVENLFDERHVEAEDFIDGTPGVELDRSYFARITWRPGR